ncbi:MAG: 4-(cytidine 5'-diphospho)-2-C-methyl-D-erythritol kinase [Actinobacteria bacterium]|jgi:4-diphosphocytidyl-2-C-methyl-D-erythritol kinase|nr:4-(cytidine 5'-diphospho)-2-C-methyl-D-erythritol kinase [Actinomycetota bacterium]NDA38627.1 4-(cytidine 5'-diphospho)-2-C-methyl-D-erythritol kinase [Actinomycetota bacterium]NDE83386.1 4-(cytidine 5'-diphospho)-2-C-methyl-D-erythritol kinase [Actinomycetota bacterium]
MTNQVAVRVPGKINLQLSVGPLQRDGYHELATVFQSVSLFDEVTVSQIESGIEITSDSKSNIPLDKENLAFRAAEIMCKKFDIETGLAIKIKKEIPVAGGMAGGSADAGGTIVAIDSLFSLGLKRDEMERIGAELGADVPFTIAGGTAIGTGRGDQIAPVLSRGSYNWVLALSTSGLSTPSVYKECDRLREGLDISKPFVSDSLLQALSHGDAKALGKALSNDLQPAACSLKPALRLILDVGLDYGALGGIVSGSGPTVAFLAENEDHALDLVVALTSSGVVGNVIRVAGPVPGARVITNG